MQNSLLKIYSYLPNKRGGSNKRGGRTFSKELINGEGKNVPNKRGGWTFSRESINREGKNVPNKQGGRTFS